ncbi:MAG: winged helix-turn-helix domain-containing protein [Pyrinomonadaceae bacterium]
MSLEEKSLEFGEFVLVLKEKELMRNGERLPITPKAFQLLATLVADPGHLFEKERLMETLWPDSFVEEANLAFTVSLLRKTLGDNAQNPRFVETVPRRGYRFVGSIKERVNGNGLAKAPTVSEKVSDDQPHKSSRFHLWALAALTVGAVAVGLWYVGGVLSRNDAPILSAKFGSEKLSTDGSVRNAVISHDGKNLVYTSSLRGEQSVWVRQLESSNNAQIVPPSGDAYYGLALSPGGDVLYFVRGAPGEPEQRFDTYRISIFGGVPTKIASGTEGWISVSADGGKISFVRCPFRNDEYCSLWMADSADGRNERKVASRTRLIRIGANQISPDGKKIAFAAGQSRSGANEFGLLEVDLETGAEREVTAERFFNIRNLAWLPDQRGLLMTAKKNADKNYRIWHVSTKTGEIAALTNDSDDYHGISLNGDASALVSTTVMSDYRLKVYQPENPAGPARVLAEAVTVGFAPSGTILFSSGMTGNRDIWSINVDGGEQRQLTNHPALDFETAASPDGRFVFFESNRTGANQVWRMNADGSDQLQITFNGAGQPRRVSPDGKWLYYLSKPERRLMRVPTEGGEEELVFDKGIDTFAITPDTSHLAFSEVRPKGTITIVTLANKRAIKTFNIPNEKTSTVQFAWSADGKGLYYVAFDEISGRQIVWRLPLDGKSPVRVADLGAEELRASTSFAVSPDGGTFAAIQGGWKHDAVLIKGLR